uniref:hypothetical protein n=1 Tax=Caballeronia sordidicola TaxID=196367 RepID=UPI0004D0371D
DMRQGLVHIFQPDHGATPLLNQELHFCPEELLQLEKVYAGILKASVTNLDQVFVVINSFKTQMSDAARMKLIDDSAKAIEENFADLKQYNEENMVLSSGRSKSKWEADKLKDWYGLD